MIRTINGRPARTMRRVAAMLLAAAALLVTVAAPVAAGGPSQASGPTAARPLVLPASATKRACAVPAAGRMRCHAIKRTDIAPLSPHAASLTPAAISGYTPAQLQSAYALTSAALTNGVGATVAIVDAYDAPNAEADLAAYRAQFGLPACTTANGCFRKVDEYGGTAYPPADGGWAQEIALDLDMVSAICPRCSILLVEADTAGVDDLGLAVNLAVEMGAQYVSNSYGGPEADWAMLADSLYFNHPGVVLTASTGDYGYEVEYPAASPDVVAVGGTSLVMAANTRGWSESAWSGAGSGCSIYEAKPSWQHDAGCPNRMVADVSAVANPATGVAVLAPVDGLGMPSQWAVFGGTSASAPIVAAVYALAGKPLAGSYPAAYPYLRGGLNDATGGANGSCATPYFCTGVAGYDGPTGLGTPNGAGAFVAAGPPSAPSGVKAAPGNGSTAVSWTAPASSGGLAISGYTATVQPGGRTCATTTLGCTVTGLANGTGYRVTVTASNKAGPGPASSPGVSVTPRTVPGAPTGVLATGGNRSALVSWVAPASNGGAAISKYTVTASPSGATCAWSSGPLECTVAGLANGAPYTFTVVATNAAGPGAPSPASAAATPRSVPGAPSAVTATPAAPTYGALALTWAAPADNGGSPITGYTATAYLASTLGSTGHACGTSGSAPATHCTITGLTPGVAVFVRVRAASAVGTGLPSPRSATVTPPTAPTAAIGTLATWALTTPVTIRWSGVAGTNPIASYDVRYRRAAWSGAFGAMTTWKSATAATSAAFGATPGNTYCFSVRARDSKGFASTAWSAEKCIAMPLDDRSLTRYGTWSTGTGTAYYRGTWVRATAYGARVVRTSVVAKRISLIVTTCATCGSARVYWGSTLLKTVSLVSTTTVNRKVIPIVAFTSARSGTVTVKVSTSGRKVIIDGLAISRV